MSTQAERSYRWLFWCLALIGLTVDQASKYGVFAWLYDGSHVISGDGRRSNSQPLISGAFWLNARYTAERDPGEGLLGVLRTAGGHELPEVNQGALWGLGSGMNTFFAAISLGAAVAIVLWSCRSRAAKEGYLCFALGLILAGTLGNFYDRVVFGGVRDFLHWNYLFDFPVFNFADCCLVCGAGLLLLQAFYGQPDIEPQAVAQATSTAEHVAEMTQ